MNLREFIVRSKPHLIFGGMFLIVLFLNTTIALMAGETFLGATWKAISEIKPMDYAMFVIFWYACSVHRPKDDWDSSLIVLNLSGSNSQK